MCHESSRPSFVEDDQLDIVGYSPIIQPPVFAGGAPQALGPSSPPQQDLPSLETGSGARGGSPHSWMAFVRENPQQKWMIYMGVPPF